MCALPAQSYIQQVKDERASVPNLHQDDCFIGRSCQYSPRQEVNLWDENELFVLLF